jgi:hypothetical protein
MRLAAPRPREEEDLGGDQKPMGDTNVPRPATALGRHELVGGERPWSWPSSPGGEPAERTESAPGEPKHGTTGAVLGPQPGGAERRPGTDGRTSARVSGAHREPTAAKAVDGTSKVEPKGEADGGGARRTRPEGTCPNVCTNRDGRREPDGAGRARWPGRATDEQGARSRDDGARAPAHPTEPTPRDAPRPVRSERGESLERAEPEPSRSRAPRPARVATGGEASGEGPDGAPSPPGSASFRRRGHRADGQPDRPRVTEAGERGAPSLRRADTPGNGRAERSGGARPSDGGSPERASGVGGAPSLETGAGSPAGRQGSFRSWRGRWRHRPEPRWNGQGEPQEGRGRGDAVQPPTRRIFEGWERRGERTRTTGAIRR